MGPVYEVPREQLTAEQKAASLRNQIMDVVDQIRWFPAFGYERELDWLHTMSDWMISKKRYWGLALPIWECTACDAYQVIGGREELGQRVDEVVDVVIEEATEDAQNMGGVLPLGDSYFQTRWAGFVWKRGSWLVLLFVAQLLTATVVRENRDMLAATVELVLFIPLIIASGGNAGSQSATLIIRAMAVDELRPADWARVAGRELLIHVGGFQRVTTWRPAI